MTSVLRVRGVPYSSIEEVANAVKQLAADVMLLDPEDERYEPTVMHVGELLSVLPDELASELLTLITPATVNTPPDDSTRTPNGEKLGEGAGGAHVAESVAPVCPMCLGEGVLETEPPQDPTTERCPACNGYGKVYTGSRVDGHTTRSCPTCNGNGYISKQPSIPLPPPPVRAAAAPSWPGAEWNPTTQEWDAPPGEAPWSGARWNSIEGKYE